MERRIVIAIVGTIIFSFFLGLYFGERIHPDAWYWQEISDDAIQYCEDKGQTLDILWIVGEDERSDGTYYQVNCEVSPRNFESSWMGEYNTGKTGVGYGY